MSIVSETSVARLTAPQATIEGAEVFWREIYAGLASLARANGWVARERLRVVIARRLTSLATRSADRSVSDSAAHASSPLVTQKARWSLLLDGAETLAQLTQAYAAVIHDYSALEASLSAGIASVEVAPARHETQALLETLLAHPPTPGPEVIFHHTLSIVLPAYNEEVVIKQTAQACIATAERFCPNVEILIVNDGSRDATGQVLDALALENAAIRPLRHAVNKGYGAALLTGFAAAQGDYLFFMDSDGQFAIEDIALLLQREVEQPGVVVLGYRKRRQDSPLRRLNAWGWKQLVGLVLGLHHVRDIDCAFKLFPTQLVRVCNVTAQGAMVNTELLIKLQKMHAPMVQLPVRHFPRVHGSATGANLRVIAKAFQEMIRLRLRLHEWQAPALPPTVGPSATETAK